MMNGYKTYLSAGLTLAACAWLVASGQLDMALAAPLMGLALSQMGLRAAK